MDTVTFTLATHEALKVLRLVASHKDDYPGDGYPYRAVSDKLWEQYGEQYNAWVSSLPPEAEDDEDDNED